ncbi:hypothetical protein [Paraburkholderia sp. RL18-085-BIA-A]|uniref:hypothetical protein n=1 Tax=Paraburkholderia sp. RL18-085-BIA-A TaxID=3031633 RepID=UPI0038B8B0F0
MTGDLVPLLLDPLISALGSTDPARVKRENGSVDHVIAAPPMTRSQLVQWLFEGRVKPPPSRVRPDPVVGQADDPQRRFLLRLKPEEVRYLRSDFARRWLDSGPGWFLESALPAWIPNETKAAIGELDRGGAFRRTLAPVVKTFPGPPPYGRIVLWYGAGDFLTYDELWTYQEFPADETFYETLPGLAGSNVHLVWEVLLGLNKDLDLFVIQRHMRPDRAREELQRIWGGVFRGVVEGAMNILQLGTSIAGMNRLASFAESAVEAQRKSIQQNRRLVSLWARTRSPFEVLFRGATLKKIVRDLGVAERQHDLGAGTYFTPSKRVASFFAARKELPGDPGVVLRVTIDDPAELGTVLDLLDNSALAKEWAEEVKAYQKVSKIPLHNEPYFTYLEGFLNKKGLSLGQYKTVIGWDYLNDAVQFCIKDDGIVETLLRRADEVLK